MEPEPKFEPALVARYCRGCGRLIGVDEMVSDGYCNDCYRTEG